MVFYTIKKYNVIKQDKTMKNIYKFVISIVICESAGVLGSIFTTPAINTWYANLNKPSFTPPGSFIGAVWVILFFLMGVSLYLVWSKNWQVAAPTAAGAGRKTWNPITEKLWSGTWREENNIAIFALQLILNILWSVIFFGLKLPGLALFELIALWFAILYTIVNFHRISKPASYLLLPYIAWVSFAGYLNFVLWRMN
jgi:benzodiazapine receptor